MASDERNVLQLPDAAFSLRSGNGAHAPKGIPMDESARRIQSAALAAIQRKGGEAIEQATGISETRLSNFKNIDANGGGLKLPEIATLFATLDLAVIDTRDGGAVTIPRAEYEALRTLAKKALEQA